MKFDVRQETQSKALEMLEKSTDKSKAIVEVMQMLMEDSHSELISQLQSEAEQLRSQKATAEQLGLKVDFTAEEKNFLESLRNPVQSFTGDQIDVLPTTYVDRTLDNVKKSSKVISELINFAPAGVKKWLTGSKTGTSAWTGLTSALVNELTATISSLNLEAGKLYAVLIIPKAISDLANSFVDKYIIAIMNEAFEDGIVKGWAYGNGGTAGVIGVTKKIAAYNENGTNQDKEVTSITGFTPKAMAPVKSTLTNNGLRAVPKIYIVANPLDVYRYVDPALYILNSMGVYTKVSKDDIVVIEEPNIVATEYYATSEGGHTAGDVKTAGKAIITIPGKYTMGFSRTGLKKYTETKALDDADLYTLTAYGNGRADDDNTAVVIDVTQLAEATLPKHRA